MQLLFFELCRYLEFNIFCFCFKSLKIASQHCVRKWTTSVLLKSLSDYYLFPKMKELTGCYFDSDDDVIAVDLFFVKDEILMKP